MHDTLKTAGDYQAYLAQAFPSLPEDAIEVRWSSLLMPPGAAVACATRVHVCTADPGRPSREPLWFAPTRVSVIIRRYNPLGMQMAAPQLVECPVSNGGTTIRCSKLNRCVGCLLTCLPFGLRCHPLPCSTDCEITQQLPAQCPMLAVWCALPCPPCSRRVALVGDAAHAVVPSLGQGANAGLEGAATLAAVIQGGPSRSLLTSTTRAGILQRKLNCELALICGPWMQRWAHRTWRLRQQSTRGAGWPTLWPWQTCRKLPLATARVPLHPISRWHRQASGIDRYLCAACIGPARYCNGQGVMLSNAAAALCSFCTLQLISQMLLHKVLPFLVPKPAFFLASLTAWLCMSRLASCNARPGQRFVVGAALATWL